MAGDDMKFLLDAVDRKENTLHCIACMDLSGAVQWWEEWQLRILVLGSLFVHIFLYFSAIVRKLSFRISIMRVLRLLVWLAYIGSDALAIYALATLFNRQNQHHHQQHQQKWRSHTLEVLWAPVLLIHLGGQRPITAYSLEDNELWMRYTMTIVSQVTIACYVFYKQWPGSGGERRLLQAAVLLFVVGILKFSQKPWALWSASFNTMLASDTKTKSPSLPRSWWSWRWTRWCTSYFGEIYEALMLRLRAEEGLAGGGGDQGHGGAFSLQDYVRDARTCVNTMITDKAVKASATGVVITLSSDVSSPVHHANSIRKLFVDRPVPYMGRLMELRSFQWILASDNPDPQRAVYRLLQQYLLDTYSQLYTRLRATATPLGVCFVILFPLLAAAAAVLFSMSRKDGYNQNDVWVTYVLFYGTAVQEFIFILLHRARSPCLAKYGYGNWSSMVYQHSLLSFCARKRQPPMGMKLAAFSDCLRDYISKHWYIRQVPEALPITTLVCQHVTDGGWKEYVRDATSYRRFGNLRGQRAVSLSQRRHQLRRRLEWSFEDLQFDESVLLWHIATDLCFHHQSSTPPGQGDADADATPPTPRRTREISNYMIYLLFIRPEMLMPGTRPSLFTDASHEIEVILKDSKAPHSSNTEEEGSFVRLIKDTVMERLSSTDADTHTATATKGFFIGKACMLADALIMELPDEKERWQLIQGVWVEMLCYSASRCSGYLHARRLGEGGEYLSYVWLLWFIMGMETLADRHQRPEPPQREEDHDDDAWASGARGGAQSEIGQV